MPDVDASTQSWIQAGGLTVFASAVLLWLRDFKKESGVQAAAFKKEITDLVAGFTTAMREVGQVMGDTKALMAALLERERARAERLAAKDAAATRARTATPAGGVPEAFDDDPDTQPVATFLPERPARARTNPGGEYSIRGKTDR